MAIRFWHSSIIRSFFIEYLLTKSIFIVFLKKYFYSYKVYLKVLHLNISINHR